jgi:hypothetical protein
MPTNGESDYLLFGLDSVPIFTYGMIVITTIVLAYTTIMDDSDVPTPNEIIKDTTNVMLGENNETKETKGGSKQYKLKKTRRNRQNLNR